MADEQEQRRESLELLRIRALAEQHDEIVLELGSTGAAPALSRLLSSSSFRFRNASARVNVTSRESSQVLRISWRFRWRRGWATSPSSPGTSAVRLTPKVVWSGVLR